MIMTTKIRLMEIEHKDNSQYVIRVDGQQAKTGWNSAVINDGDHYGIDMDKEVICRIMRELTLEFNLTEFEQEAYEKTLKYILED